jgi:hypothetical protein
MYRIENAAMLEFLKADNKAAHYDSCLNIVSAGLPTHAIKSVVFFTDEKDTPKVERVEFTAYVFCELCVRIYTADAALIAAACERIREIQSEYERVYIETPTELDLSGDATILKYFDVPAVYGDGALGIFGLLSEDGVPPLNLPDGIDIHVATDAELEYAIEHSGDENMIIQFAKDKLGLVLPGERIFYDKDN